jgi:transcription initiation factor TFIIH subunit 3
MAPNRSDENPLTALIIDVSPVAWGDRDLRRTAGDRKRHAAGKSSNGQPLILEELLSSVQAFASALVSLERESALIIIAVAGNEVAIVHPRKDHLESFFSNTEMKQDTRKIQSDLIQGVSELVARAAKHVGDPSQPISASQAAMSSAFSVSLCLINRFLVATNAGVSALHAGNAWNRGNVDDEGVIAAIAGSGKKKTARKARAWSPRVLMIQASDDRPGDYNAIMNCAFASVKHQIVVDGCFLRCDDTNKSSALLEQTCDLTGGLFLVR